MQKTEHLTGGHQGKFICALAVAAALALAAPAKASSLQGDMFMGVLTTHTVKKHESLFDIARKYDMGIIELEAANPGVNPWKPKPGTQVTVATRHVVPSLTREGIVVNLTSSRLFYFKSPSEVLTFPIASGKEGWETPVAATSVVEKRLHPTWTPPPRIREENPDLPESIPPGPDNPLGNYALALGLDGIMIHGTNAPSSIGKHASHGCIRMYPEDIESLFNAVKRGTPVLLTRTPYVLGWQGDTLYLEVTPKVTKPKAKKNKPVVADKLLREAVEREAGADATINWDAVDTAVARADGIPVAVGTRPLYGPPSPHPDGGLERRAALQIINDAAN